MARMPLGMLGRYAPSYISCPPPPTPARRAGNGKISQPLRRCRSRAMVAAPEEIIESLSPAIGRDGLNLAIWRAPGVYRVRCGAASAPASLQCQFVAARVHCQ